MAVRIRSHPQATESFAVAEASSDFERTDMPTSGDTEELMKIVENARVKRYFGVRIADTCLAYSLCDGRLHVNLLVAVWAAQLWRTMPLSVRIGFTDFL
jgi:hypothetical protein